MELLLLILAALGLLLLPHYLLIKGKLQALERAIFIADNITHLIDKIDDWQKEENFNPMVKGIDPHDVFTSLWDAQRKGKESLQKELNQYGNIEQL